MSSVPYAVDQKRHWGLPAPAHLQHGPGTRACQIYGCSCSTCLPSGRRRKPHGKGDSSTVRQRRSRHKLKGKPVPPGVKHGIYAFKYYGCKCEDCQAANRERLHRQRHPWMYRETRGHWSTRGDLTVLHWPPAAAGKDWTCPECGEVA